MSIVALPDETPVRVPMSVPPAAVVQVREPKGDGTVTLALLELTVPFVVPAMFETERFPGASTTTDSSVQLPKDKVLIGPLTAVPVKVLVVPSTADEVHVLARPPPVADRSAEVLDSATR
jgi:hypothetical protein